MDRIIEVVCSYSVVVGLGGIGIILGIFSLWLRYKDVRVPWARRLCLFSDILNTTFVSITVVGVLTVSFELAIHLPSLARSQDIPERVNVSDLATRTEIGLLIQELGKRRDLHSTIESLHNSGELDDESLALAVGRTLGYIPAYESIDLAGQLPGGGNSWRCYIDGGFHCRLDGH